MLLQGAQINTQDDAEWTPLHWASYLGHTEVVRLLLMSGASEKIKSKGRRGILSFEGSTALDHAKNDETETRAVFEDFKGDQGNDRVGHGGRLGLGGDNDDVATDEMMMSIIVVMLIMMMLMIIMMMLLMMERMRRDKKLLS